jgi:hypothetical protein
MCENDAEITRFIHSHKTIMLLRYKFVPKTVEISCEILIGVLCFDPVNGYKERWIQLVGGIS